jgi:hypothetical protein
LGGCLCKIFGGSNVCKFWGGGEQFETLGFQFNTNMLDFHRQICFELFR